MNDYVAQNKNNSRYAHRKLSVFFPQVPSAHDTTACMTPRQAATLPFSFRESSTSLYFCVAPVGCWPSIMPYTVFHGFVSPASASAAAFSAVLHRQPQKSLASAYQRVLSRAQQHEPAASRFIRASQVLLDRSQAGGGAGPRRTGFPRASPLLPPCDQRGTFPAPPRPPASSRSPSD